MSNQWIIPGAMAAAFGAYYLLRRQGGPAGTSVAATDVKGAQASTSNAAVPTGGQLPVMQAPQLGYVTRVGANLTRTAWAPPPPPPPMASPPPPPGNGPSANAIGQGIGAAAGVAGCAALSSGIGVTAAPLCGAIGGWAGGQAVDAGNAIGSWVKGLF